MRELSISFVSDTPAMIRSLNIVRSGMKRYKNGGRGSMYRLEGRQGSGGVITCTNIDILFAVAFGLSL